MTLYALCIIAFYLFRDRGKFSLENLMVSLLLWTAKKKNYLKINRCWKKALLKRPLTYHIYANDILNTFRCFQQKKKWEKNGKLKSIFFMWYQKLWTILFRLWEKDYFQCIFNLHQMYFLLWRSCFLFLQGKLKNNSKKKETWLHRFKNPCK